MQKTTWYLLLFPALLLCACQSRQKRLPVLQRNDTMDSALALGSSGDLILRSGNDETSRFFAGLNTKNKKYSHCGMVLRTDSGLFVYHLIGAGFQQGKMKCEPIVSFIARQHCSGWGLVRYQLNKEQRERFVEKVGDYYRQEISFDLQFDLRTDTSMYCSEMIYKALLVATKDSGFIPKTKAKSGKEYIAIDNLFEHKHAETICEIAY